MKFRQQLAFYIEDVETPIGIAFNLLSLSLTLLSLSIFIIGTFKISASWQNFLHLLDTIILIIFTVEFLLRLYSSENKLKFVFSLFGLIDLITILPILLNWFRYQIF